MGFAAAIASAATWAMSSALMASEAARVDTISLSGLRALWGALFFLVALFALGAQGDLARMGAGDMAQLITSALLGLALGDTLYITSMVLLGMARAFTVSLGLYTLFSYGLAALFLSEPVGWQAGAGALIVVLGVSLVGSRGRATESPIAVLAPGPVLETDPDALPRQPGLRLRATAGPLIAGGGGPASPGLAGRLAPAGPWGSEARVALGLVLVLLAALAWAVATVLLRSAAEGFDAAAVGAIRIPAAAAVLMAVAAAQRRSSVRRRAISRRSLAVLGVTGIVGTGVGSLLFIFAVQEVGAGKAAVLSSVSPLFALPLGLLFLRESITSRMVAGTLIAVAGIILLS